MAMRHDYYSECAAEIERKIELITGIKEELQAGNYDEDCGIENSSCSDELESEVDSAVDLLNELIDTLNSEKKKLASSISDVGGWF
ncbi:MAG: hypothetical protein ACK5NF_03495 [Bacilli bacterium]